MNELREAALAWEHREMQRNPRPYYCTGPDRFGPRCRDCTGNTSQCWLEAANIHIGRDTAELARDARAGKVARFVPISQALPGDILIHGPRDRYGNVIYNGGGDEHAEMFVLINGDRAESYGSASSQHGQSYNSRLISWWTHCVRYYAFDQATNNPPQEDDVLTDAQVQLLFSTIHDLHVENSWSLAGHLEGGYDNRKLTALRLPKIQADVHETELRVVALQDENKKLHAKIDLIMTKLGID